MLNKFTRSIICIDFYKVQGMDPSFPIGAGFYYQNAMLYGVQVKNSYLSLI